MVVGVVGLFVGRGGKLFSTYQSSSKNSLLTSIYNLDNCKIIIYNIEKQRRDVHTLSQLEKQQVGLRLHSYLVEEIDELTKLFSVNRTDIIVEAIKSYLSQQRANMAYEGIENAFMELKNIREGKKETSSLGTLDDLIDELKHS